jgi:hypothetical protein
MMSDHEEQKLFWGVAGAATMAVAAAILSGCYAPPRTHVVATETVVERSNGTIVALRPPAERTEVIPAAPSDRVVWQQGRWRWDGNGYVWVAGHYVDRPYAQAQWEPGHWVDHGDGWVWDEGHWRT